MSVSTRYDICCYRRHPCSRPRYQKYNFCAQHVLEDTSSPFTSCEYISRASGRKCPNPALRSNRPNKLSLPVFCDDHLRDLIVKERHQRNKRKLRKKRKNQTVEKSSPALAKRRKLISQLCKRYNQETKSEEDQGDSSDVEEVHRPVKDDWLLEDSDDVGNDADWDDFDLVNNEVYEPLRYAGVLTPEEVVATAQNKLIRLQTLYAEQFKRLFHLLKERRRQYLHERKKEMKEEKAGASSRKQDDDYCMDEDEIYALATYRRRTGIESLLRKRQLKRRQESDGSTSNFAAKSPQVSRCSHMSNHTRCKGTCLPYTKYCTLHILEDPHQQLYRKCHTEDCPSPVCFLISLPYEAKVDDAGDKTEEVCYCSLHAPLPEMTLDFLQLCKFDVEEMEVDVESSSQNPAEGEKAIVKPMVDGTEFKPSEISSEVKRSYEAPQHGALMGQFASENYLNNEGAAQLESVGEIATDSECARSTECVDRSGLDLSQTLPVSDETMDSQCITEHVSDMSFDSSCMQPVGAVTASLSKQSIDQSSLSLASLNQEKSELSLMHSEVDRPQMLANLPSSPSAAAILEPALLSTLPAEELVVLPSAGGGPDSLQPTNAVQESSPSEQPDAENASDSQLGLPLLESSCQTRQAPSLPVANGNENKSPAHKTARIDGSREKLQTNGNTVEAMEQVFESRPSSDRLKESLPTAIGDKTEEVSEPQPTPPDNLRPDAISTAEEARDPPQTSASLVGMQFFRAGDADDKVSVPQCSASPDSVRHLGVCDPDGEISVPQCSPPPNGMQSLKVGDTGEKASGPQGGMQCLGVDTDEEAFVATNSASPDGIKPSGSDDTDKKAFVPPDGMQSLNVGDEDEKQSMLPHSASPDGVKPSSIDDVDEKASVPRHSLPPDGLQSLKVGDTDEEVHVPQPSAASDGMGSFTAPSNDEGGSGDGDEDPSFAKDDPTLATQSYEGGQLLLDAITGLMVASEEAHDEASDAEPAGSPQVPTGDPVKSESAMTGDANNNSSMEAETASEVDQDLQAGTVLSTSHAANNVATTYASHSGERKPSSVEEEMAVVSLLSLSSSTPSSSTDQE